MTHIVMSPIRGVPVEVPNHIDAEDVGRKEAFMLAVVPDAMDFQLNIALNKIPWISAEEKAKRQGG